MSPSRKYLVPTYGTGICTGCGKEYALRKNMVIQGHKNEYGVNCLGSNKKPKTTFKK